MWLPTVDSRIFVHILNPTKFDCNKVLISLIENGVLKCDVRTLKLKVEAAEGTKKQGLLHFHVLIGIHTCRFITFYTLYLLFNLVRKEDYVDYRQCQ